MRRVEFLWARWLETDRLYSYGAAPRRLERLRFVSGPLAESVGFVHPSQVLRGCHLVPAFAHGRTLDYLPTTETSVLRDEDGDWKYYYMNRFVLINSHFDCDASCLTYFDRRFCDRDIFARCAGLGLGDKASIAPTVEVMVAQPKDITITNFDIVSPINTLWQTLRSGM